MRAYGTVSLFCESTVRGGKKLKIQNQSKDLQNSINKSLNAKSLMALLYRMITLGPGSFHRKLIKPEFLHINKRQNLQEEIGIVCTNQAAVSLCFSLPVNSSASKVKCSNLFHHFLFANLCLLSVVLRVFKFKEL